MQALEFYANRIYAKKYVNKNTKNTPNRKKCKIWQKETFWGKNSKNIRPKGLKILEKLFLEKKKIEMILFKKRENKKLIFRKENMKRVYFLEMSEK